MGSIVDALTNPQVLFAIAAAVAVIATVITIAMPMLATDRLGNRIKAVALERDRIRSRERAKMVAADAKKATLRTVAPKDYVRQVVEKLNLRKALADQKTLDKLRVAGFRGQAPLFIFLFARLVLPLAFLATALVYIFWIADLQHPPVVKFGIAIFVGYLGFYLPNLYVRNRTQKRQVSIQRAWPDALDLLLICVESGMSAEASFRKVAEEIGIQSVDLAEELMLTTAELSYLPERKQAYENLAARTGLDGVKSVTMALVQAERYGTPLGNTLRMMAQENRDQRMNNAEKKAAALPPKLTVPMILFFLPVLFAVIIGPAVIQYLNS